MIRALISDFGGVLTTPLIESFLAYQRESGISLEDLGAAMAKLMQEDDGRHPLFELEKGNISEDEFTRRLGAALGRELTSMRDTYFENLHANEPMIEWGWTWHILADPDGNEFCVVQPPESHWTAVGGETKTCWS